MQFASPEILYLIPIVIATLVAFRLVAARSARHALDRMVAPRLRESLLSGSGALGGWVVAMLQIVGIAFLIGALARPQWGKVSEDADSEGRNIILALDTSRSMLAQDLLPDRFERARLAAQDLVRALPNDRFGLVAFAGQAFIQAPLTIDHAAIIESLGQLDTNVIPRGGTNIERAIALAIETFGKAEGAEHALVLFTDGDDLEGDAEAAARDARENGVMVVAVGVGTTAGDLIPDGRGAGSDSFVRDENGNAVLSRLGRNGLSKLAANTRGIYIDLGTQDSTQKTIIDALDEIERTRGDARATSRPIERFQWFLGAAFLCFTFGFLAPLVFAPASARAREPESSADGAGAARAAAVAAVLAVVLTPRDAGAATPYESLVEGEYEESMDAYQAAAERSGSGRSAARPYFGMGAAAYRAGEFDRAIDGFGQALLSPQTGRQEAAHYNPGNTLYRRGQSLRDTPPTDPGAPPDLEMMALAIRDWREAIDHYETTLELNPENEDAAFNKQLVEEQLQELEQAFAQEVARQAAQQGQEGQEGEEGQEGQDGQPGQQGDGDQKGESGDGQDGNEGDGSDGEEDGDGSKSDFENPSEEDGGGGDEESDDPGDGDGKLEAINKAPGSGSGAERSGDKAVNPDTGFSKFQARQLLENLADEDLSAKPADRGRTNESYKNW